MIYDPDLEVGSRLERALTRVGSEVYRAQQRFAAFNSPHEGWAVIREELDELWEAVKANRGRSDDAKMEAIQVAAMAVRYVLDLPPLATPEELTPRGYVEYGPDGPQAVYHAETPDAYLQHGDRP